MLLLWWLAAELSLRKNFLPDEVVTVLEFLEPMKKPKPVEIMPDVHIPKQSSKKSERAISKTTVVTRPATTASSPAKKNTNQSLTLFDETGRVRLPVDFIERLDEANPPGKRFDFINPDLELAGTFLKRPPAIEFNPTQFEQAWKPDQDILNELLEKAVEKTTKEIKIPVPGNPTVKLVCKVSVLALGGGCGFVPNGGYGRVIADDEDDPETLSPEENKQCQAWWEKISDTRSHSEWKKTKELYELTCKKPLAKEKIKPFR
ncbi:MAG: hypothetical protein ACREO1_04670 [Arenimonas sp.]